MVYNNPIIIKEGDAVDNNCNEAEGARLLETMRKICDATGCMEVEHATLAYEEALQATSVGMTNNLDRQSMK